MPNHVTHRVVFKSEAAKALFMEWKLKQQDDHGPLNFELLIPQKYHTVPSQIDAWGTKWNAYDQYVEEENGCPVLIFDTAWSTCYKIWDYIAENYPEVELLIYYADEDTGSNLGTIHIDAGEVVIDEACNDSKEKKIEVLNSVYPSADYEICTGENACFVTVDDRHEGCDDEECISTMKCQLTIKEEN